MHTVITTFNEDYYQNKGGKLMVESFDQRWPQSVQLVIYYEGDNLRKDEGRIKWRNMMEVPYLADFLKAVNHFPLMRGEVGSGKWNIEYDARMCRPGFIHPAAMEEFGGKVFWLDSDCVTHSDVPEGWLDELLPDDKLCCSLERPWFNTETGFMGMNADHPAAEQWIAIWRGVYRTGAIFTQQGWHDNWGLDLARHFFKNKELFVNLSEGLPDKCMHPFINAAPGAYMDHMKGQRKNGTSKREDLVVERTEPYWVAITGGPKDYSQYFDAIRDARAEAKTDMEAWNKFRIKAPFMLEDDAVAAWKKYHKQAA